MRRERPVDQTYLKRPNADEAQTEAARFLSLVLANRWNAILLERLSLLGMTDWWLTAGCLAQSVWNGLYGRSPDHGILDYDVFYLDSDTSWAAEDAMIKKAAALFADLPITIQIRNQARVPLWYEAKFGVPFPLVTAASDGIDRFPCGTVAVGVRREGDDFAIYAPFGLAPLLRGELIPNIVLPIPTVYAAKTRRWLDVWPDLVAIPWPAHYAAARFVAHRRGLGFLAEKSREAADRYYREHDTRTGSAARLCRYQGLRGN